MSTKFNKSIFTIMLVLMMATALAGSAQAVHDDDLFQLDYVTSPTARGAANVSSTNISPTGNDGDDWDNVYKSVTGLGPAGPSSAFANSWIADGVGSDEESFFTGGGSKDTNDIPDWLYDTVNDVVPDKDDIEHAFAAAYEREDDGHVIVYFGADRFDAGDGSAELGFWFFRDDVKLNPLAPGETTGDFSGVHRVGDLLVLVEFVKGGAVGQVNVYEWDGAGGDNLSLLLTKNAADCATIGANDPACAVINNTVASPAEPPWPYINKDGATTYAQFALFEGGIDFTEVLGGDIGCFSSFMAETRSSGSSVQAQLKDFALGAFPICGIDVVKTGDVLSKVGDPANYTVTITNTGKATLYKRNISDTVLGAVTIDGVDQANTNVVTNTCGASLAAGASCTITFQYIVQPDDPDPLPNTVSILYSEFADFTGLEFDDSADHEVNLFQPAVMITKEGDTLSKVTDPVTYTFTITNKSSEDSPDLVLATISDNVIGDLKADATAAGCDTLTFKEECSFNITRTVQAGDGDPLTNTVDVLYNPVGFPNEITASDGHAVNLFQPSVSITKNGDTLSKIGDEVTYKVSIANTSSGDSPNLILDSIVDDVLGDLSDEAPVACDSLAPGASCEFEVPWTVAAVDVNPADGKNDDPVINTVTIHFHPDGFTNDITATASHELNLFQPSIAFSKTADTELSKIGDVVNYMITLNNTSSPDTPDLVCSIKDALLGVDKTVTLSSGSGDVTNVAYTVQAGDPDPLVNTASVSCSPQGFPNVLSDTKSWTVNLFQPAVTIVKGGDTLSKVGDTVTYSFAISNGSSSDSPDLKLDSISDTVLGDLLAAATAAGCDNLTPGAGCDFTVDRTVQETDLDPLPNTVTVHYHPVGFTNDITDDDGHEVNLFQPSITFDKTGDALSKIGDQVIYTLTLNNTSSTDSPKLNCTVTDTLLGLATEVNLQAGGTITINKPFIIPADAEDPFVNTASIACRPDGFPNVLTAENGHEINLFQPSIEVKKTGPAFTKAGDTNTYEVTVTNTSSDDTPELVDGTLTDTLAGDLLDAANAAVTSSTCDGSLAFGESCKVTYEYVTQAGDPDPLVNKAEANFNPDGFPNDITDSAEHSSDVLHPAFTATKVCKAEPISQAGPAVFTITFNNTGDADLHVVPSEGLPFDVAAGQSHSYDYSINGPFSDSVSNTVTGTVTLDPKYGLSNTYTFSSTDTCDVKGKVKVVKTVSGQPPAAGQSFTFELRQGASTASDGTVLETKTTDALGNISFSTELNPGQTYQLCEWVFPGWNTNLAGDGPLFVPNSIIPPALPNPNVNNLTVCTNFSVSSGQTRTFTVDNTPPPGGRALTIGFWKNWASCASSNGKGQDPMLDLALAYASQMTTNPPGGLVVSAQNAGSGWPNYAPTHYLVLKGNPASTEDNILSAPDCARAVSLLDKRSFDGKKKASDPLFNMAAQLVGAELNRFMGAGINGTTIMNIDRAVLLLGQYKFNGSTYSPKLSAADTALANCLATQLDNYNNNNAVNSCP